MPLEFDPLYRAELPYALRTLRRLGVCEADLDDAAHEMFVAVYVKLDAYDDTRPVRPWLFGFAYRIARDFRRRHDRRQTEPLNDEMVGTGLDATPDLALERRQKQRLAVRCLAALPEDKAAILVLHELDGLAVPEIALLLSIPINTAYSRLRLAREAFETVACRMNPRERL